MSCRDAIASKNYDSATIKRQPTRRQWRYSLAFLALKMGHTQLFYTILTHPNLDFKLQDKHGDTIARSAVINGHPEALKILMDNASLHTFVSNNNDDSKDVVTSKPK